MAAASARTTACGTQYLGLDAYEMKDGVMVPKANAPKLASPAPAVAAAAAGGAASASSSEDMTFLLALGLTESKAKETAQNAELTADLKSFVAKVGGLPIDKNTANLVYDVASRYRSSVGTTTHVDFLLQHLKSKTVANKAQLEAALAYLKQSPDNLSGFDAAAGVGVHVTPEQIHAEVNKVFEAKKAEIAEKRYHTNTGLLLAAVRATLPWGDAKVIKDTIDAKLAATLGPRTAKDDEPLAKEKKKAAKPTKEADGAASAGAASGAAAAEVDMTFVGAAAAFHAPGHNDETANYLPTPNTKRLLAEHLKRTGGKVRTRFPPEPNGILHIGHAKAMNFNFSYASARGGVCYLRYDDTNPEKEEKEFFDGILRDVQWLGHRPWKVTYASDHFQQLYEWAIVLINKGLAYVCHQKVEEIRGHDNRVPSPWRERPVAESLKLFEDMKHGLIDEGQATLRLKHEMEDGKLDPVAYRILFHPHHRTGSTWCIYPTYDYTHCLCDSIEDITHSLCTKEFQNRRYSYYWLCNALDLYCPVQWEYGRLNMEYAVTSKRKIAELIRVGAVSGWDDPRLFTISALRRKGYPPKALNDFCARLGVTVASSVIGPDALDACVRDLLNTTAPRAMAVLDPLKVVIMDFAEDKTETINVLNIPKEIDPASPTHAVPLSRVLYIDRADFLPALTKGYKRLAPGQAVGLKHAGYVIAIKDVVLDDAGRPVELHVTSEHVTDKNKPAAFIHWVSSVAGKSPSSAEVRVFNPLFTLPNPDEAAGGYLTALNKNSLTLHHALIDAFAATAGPGSSMQFERVGYFTYDVDSTHERLVFNCTASLKEDAGKKKA